MTPRAALCCLILGLAALRPAGAAGPTGALTAPGTIEHWAATSTTAMSITGDVTFAPHRITFQNGRALPLLEIGHESAFKAMGETVDATIYRVTEPADLTLLNANHLCGGGAHTSAVTFIAVWVPAALPGDAVPRSMAAFSGQEPPRSAAGARTCGIYNFELRN